MKRFFCQPLCMSTAFPDAASAKKTASAMFGTDGMRLRLVWTALICLTLGGGSLYLIEGIFAIVPWATLHDTSPLAFGVVNALYVLTDITFTVLVIFPLIHGAARIFLDAAYEKKSALSTLFCAFDSAQSYRRAVAVTTALALPRMLLFLVLRALCRMALNASGPLVAVFWWLLALALLAVATLLLGLDDALLPFSLKNETLGLFKLYRISIRLCAPRLVRIWRFKLGYLHWGILSILTLGILLFTHALPHYCIAHTAWTDDIYHT